LFSNPFNFSDKELDLIDLNFQMEAVDLKTNLFLKNKFLETRSNASNEISFWKLLPDSQFPNLKTFAKKCICRFGTTYKCEQNFSTLNVLKNKYRNQLTDEHLSNLLRLGSSNLQPEIEKLIAKKRIHKSH
jgi:murein L,D-transpeptidase YafK